MKTSTAIGTVYLVGAGPGDPDLITMRGHRLLQEADVVVHDRLVHPDLLEIAPPEAERIFVGKSPGHHVVEQELINEILIDRARRHAVVVRLKGGDPFVFGRGAEEALALREEGIPFEIVPGITSAVSVPAYAGIPVTHREMSPAFTVVTGHTCEASSEVEWASFSACGTLVILMGLSRLPQIAQALIDAGKAPSTPVAVIQTGTTDGQVVVTGTLLDIAVRARHLKSPATIVVGEVVSLHQDLSWFSPADQRSLATDAAETERGRYFTLDPFENDHARIVT